jgi:hypothetical protein
MCSRKICVLVLLNRCKDENRSARTSYYQAILQGAAYLEDSQCVRDGAKELRSMSKDLRDRRLVTSGQAQRPHRILGTPPYYKTLYLPTA